jgi:hypothetical protein
MDDTQNQRISTSHGLAMIVMTCSVVFPSLVQFELGSTLFGEHPISKLLYIAAAGGALSGALLGGRRWWLIGLIAGAVGGVGSAGALPLYVAWGHRTIILKIEFIMALGIGAMPGLFLGALLARFAKRDPQKAKVS